MTAFADYAQYYDLLNQNKDYSSEVEYVCAKLEKYTPVQNILELGCGSGGHAGEFLKRNIRIHGIDSSQGMVDIANSRLSNAGEPYLFEMADIRNYKSSQQYDAVVSLFHVMSYLQSNEDIINTLNVAREHMRKGGLFLFDVWYGPAVLDQKPGKTIREGEDESIKVVREASSEVLYERNTVLVHYLFTVHHKKTGKVTTFSETHAMRYYFVPELELFCQLTGLKLLEINEFGTDRKPNVDTWGLSVLLGI